MKKYKAAAIQMLIHGGLMELGGTLCVIPLLVFTNAPFEIGQYFGDKKIPV